jgi:hypothetical protein
VAYIAVRKQLFAQNQIVRIRRHLISQRPYRHGSDIIGGNPGNLPLASRRINPVLLPDAPDVIRLIRKVFCPDCQPSATTPLFPHTIQIQ